MADVEQEGDNSNVQLENIKPEDDGSANTGSNPHSKKQIVVTSNVSVHEAIKRQQWSGTFQFVLATLGFAVGLGNVWRFPFQCYKHGGGAFFVPYFIMTFLLGFPIFVLELALSQFTSTGPVTCWSFAQVFKGVGIASVWVSFLVSSYYNIIMAWAFYFFFVSFNACLPWSKCAEPWASDKCVNLQTKCQPLLMEDCNWCGHFYDAENKECRQGGKDGKVILPDPDDKDVFVSLQIGLTKNSSTHLSGNEFFLNQVLGRGTAGDYDLHDMGSLQCELFICLIISWILTVLCLSKGIKSAGKVAYVTAPTPYVLMLILFIQGLTLDGATEGIKYYIVPDFSKLGSLKPWQDAATQVFFSLGTSQGTLGTLSSYNKFDRQLLFDALVVMVGNACCSIFAGFIVFSYLGFLAADQGLEVEDIADGGPGLVFSVYPMAISLLEGAPFWSALFFACVVMLGVDSQLVLVECVVTAAKDQFPKLRLHTLSTTCALCFIMFIIGVPQVFQGGYSLFSLFDTYSTGWNSLLIAFAETIGLAWFYGVERWIKDVECMLGTNGRYFCIPWRAWRIFFKVTWVAVSPAIAMTLFAMELHRLATKEDDPTEKDDPVWAKLLIAFIVGTSITCMLSSAVYFMVKGKGSFIQRFKNMTRPTEEWGPLLKEDRKKVAMHTPGLTIDLGRKLSQRSNLTINLPQDSQHLNYRPSLTASKLSGARKSGGSLQEGKRPSMAQNASDASKIGIEPSANPSQRSQM